MTDTTKCNGDGCPRKDKCYRYTAPENSMYQSRSNFEYYCLIDDMYEYYLEV